MAEEIISYDSGFGEVKVTASGRLGQLATVAKGIQAGPSGIGTIASLAPLLLAGPAGAFVAGVGMVFSALIGLFTSSEETLGASFEDIGEQITQVGELISEKILEQTEELKTYIAEMASQQSELGAMATASMTEIYKINTAIINSNYQETLTKIGEIATQAGMERNEIIGGSIRSADELIKGTVEAIYNNLKPSLQSVVDEINQKFTAEYEKVLLLAERKKYLMELKAFNLNDYFATFIPWANDQIYMAVGYRFVKR